ncbi:SRPBCC family protein [Nocardia heshunensis]
MATVRFHLMSTLSAAEVMHVLTDFGPTRPEAWPSIDADHFTVHARGENWAEVTEGTAAAWERARYDWDPAGNTVTITTLDSKLFGAGGGWVFRITPDLPGCRVDVELTRTPQAFKGKILAALLPLIGPASLRKSFAVPFQAA